VSARVLSRARRNAARTRVVLAARELLAALETPVYESKTCKAECEANHQVTCKCGEVHELTCAHECGNEVEVEVRCDKLDEWRALYLALVDLDLAELT
jgi:hypothetical protein